MKVKLFASTNIDQLEEMINKFILGFSIAQIHQIQYSTDDQHFSAMIIYYPTNNFQ